MKRSGLVLVAALSITSCAAQSAPQSAAQKWAQGFLSGDLTVVCQLWNGNTPDHPTTHEDVLLMETAELGHGLFPEVDNLPIAEVQSALAEVLESKC